MQAISQRRPGGLAQGAQLRDAGIQPGSPFVGSAQ